MSVKGTAGRRVQRAFQPALGGGLESRLLLSHSHIPGSVYLANPSLQFAYINNNPPREAGQAPPYPKGHPLAPHAATRTYMNGQKVRIYWNGGVWDVTLSPYVPAISPGGTASQAASTSAQASTTHVQAPGTVRAYYLGNNQWGIIVNGTTELSDLTINLVGFPTRVGYNQSFAYAYAARPRILNIGAIDVVSGHIGAIEGFHTADLSGPLTINGTGTTDRIAFDSILPGASIFTPGTINTLDVYNGINLNGGSSSNINIGGNLNLLNVGQNLDLSGGSFIHVGETLGLLPQSPKGTGTGSNVLTLNQSLLSGGLASTAFPNVAAYIQGSMTVVAPSTFTIGNGIGPNTVLFIGGDLTGAANFGIPNVTGVSKSYTQLGGANIVVVGTTS